MGFCSFEWQLFLIEIRISSVYDVEPDWEVRQAILRSPNE